MHFHAKKYIIGSNPFISNSIKKMDNIVIEYIIKYFNILIEYLKILVIIMMYVAFMLWIAAQMLVSLDKKTYKKINYKDKYKDMFKKK